jgi:hypothetical protein
VGVYVLRRLLIAALTVLTVSLAAFVGFGLSFDPAYQLIGNHRAHAFVVSYYHLGDPILSRYWRWLTGLFQHGFGTTVSLDVRGSIPPRLNSPGSPIGPAILHAAANPAALSSARSPRDRGASGPTSRSASSPISALRSRRF